MPAANSMVKYDASLNSGFSSGFPSFISPYLEKYRTIIKPAQASCVPMYIHVKVRVIHSFQIPICLFAASGSIMHQATKPQIINADTKETTGFKRMFIPTLDLPILHHFQFILNQRHLFKASSWWLVSLLESIFVHSFVYRQRHFESLNSPSTVGVSDKTTGPLTFHARFYRRVIYINVFVRSDDRWPRAQVTPTVESN